MKAWGMSPAEWRLLHVDDRARMMAHDLVEATRESYLAEKSAEEMERKDKGPKGPSPLERQKREWGIPTGKVL